VAGAIRKEDEEDGEKKEDDEAAAGDDDKDEDGDEENGLAPGYGDAPPENCERNEFILLPELLNDGTVLPGGDVLINCAFISDILHLGFGGVVCALPIPYGICGTLIFLDAKYASTLEKGSLSTAAAFALCAALTTESIGISTSDSFLNFVL